MRDWNVEWLLIALILMLLGGMYAAGVQEKKHADYLASHGCQLLKEAPTGRRTYCGKACWREEKVYVYECMDGTKTEVR